MPHFFINSEKVADNIATIDDEENYRHIAKSLRAKIGEKILLIDEKQIQHFCTITKIDKNTITLDVEKSEKSTRKLGFELYLAQSPLRSDAQNLIMEKAAELGVSKVYPVLTDNCVLAKDIVEKKIPKWQRIMFEASKQCERADIPECMPAIKLTELPKVDRTIVFCERYTETSLKQHLRANPIKNGEKILVLIGPEGGFSKKEFEFFQKQSMIMLTLNALILRAETAVITAIGNLIYEFENN